MEVTLNMAGSSVYRIPHSDDRLTIIPHSSVGQSVRLIDNTGNSITCERKVGGSSPPVGIPFLPFAEATTYSSSHVALNVFVKILCDHSSTTQFNLRTLFYNLFSI